MTPDTDSIRRRIREFDFVGLFIEELGWDRYRAKKLPVEADGETYRFTPIAEKRGFQVFECSPNADGSMPDRQTRLKIDNQIAKRALEHLTVYVDGARSAQRWQWSLRRPSQPVSYREDRFDAGESGARLAQKLAQLYFAIEDEDRLTIIDVHERARQAFQKDKVTKKFYERFEKERTAFVPKIEGITDEDGRKWYASVMLNRLMFVYFIQKKGFLHGDRDYLRNKLASVQAAGGRDEFYGYYRDFLLRLFHDGLAVPLSSRSPEVVALLGDVPYLNGGIFESHELERIHHDIQIPDEVFERIFDFFDGYDWHLDDRPLRDDTQINPDVLGYIFEKLINQKQMGAYYTKEDITEYISKNTIIPYLFDAAKKDCAIAFRPGGGVWSLLSEDPDRYIYEAVRKGVDIPLLPEIEAGRRDVSQRGGWNQPAEPDFALPTETWREHVARRARYEEIWGKLVAGEVTSIDDLITYNLDIRQFAQDVIKNAEGPELVRAFFQSIHRITVLDPTCGSGAFLFAALNVLEPLYDACLERMEEFVDELVQSQKQHSTERFRDFRAVLKDVEKHANRDYYIFKTIIIQNLYGVDIMEEAVEICKLRLFLKLVSQLDSVGQIEPLPDIDFNIRAGNTLVGFVSMDEVRDAIASGSGGQKRLALPEDQAALSRIEEQAMNADRAFQNFRLQQTRYGGRVTVTDKANLRDMLRLLSDELDRYLARLYGVDPQNIPDAKRYEVALGEWRATHRPFHWLADFYGVMLQGGFDVIIGNPPWVEYSKIKKQYTVKGYATEQSGNLYAYCIERSLTLRAVDGLLSFIVQLPLASSHRMAVVRQMLVERSRLLLVSTFDDRPGKLFEGLQNCRSVIFIAASETKRLCNLFVTGYHRWPSRARTELLPTLCYLRLADDALGRGKFPKFSDLKQVSVFNKLMDSRNVALAQTVLPGRTDHFIFYQESLRYWLKATAGLPQYSRNGLVSAPPHGRYLYFPSEERTNAVAAILNSSLFYIYSVAYGDCFHLNDSLVREFRVSLNAINDNSIAELGVRLMRELRRNADLASIKTRDGDVITYAEFQVSRSKSLVDDIDGALAKYYGFSAEELDFVVNFDIKFRVGQQDVGDEGE